ncbi:MAG: hypothetical protein A2252_01510 [Elusimicrobia bacterium RIFOXYA2_FULL_39_19]|nr:MAG: hypothetical protein A2252_01510 [Elusimicrobia bacterium RIFOXYA2_FULL_39_19]
MAVKDIANSGGWIKLHRKLLENPIMKDATLLQTFIYCLLKANHETRKIVFNSEVMEIKRGQFIAGRNEASKALRYKSKMWDRKIHILQKIDILTINVTNKFSLISILNWEKYQLNDQPDDQQMTNKRPTDDQQMTTNKKHKNVNKDNNEEKEQIQPDFHSIDLDGFNNTQKSNNINTKSNASGLDPANVVNKFGSDPCPCVDDVAPDVLSHWNSAAKEYQGIDHKIVSPKAKKALGELLNQGYSTEEIKTSIGNFKLIILDPDKYFWTKRWTLEEFLVKGFEKFRKLDVAQKNCINYSKSKSLGSDGFRVDPKPGEFTSRIIGQK